MKEEKMLRKLADEEKKRISTDLGDLAKYLAYTHDDGPDDVEQEPERSGIRKLKGTPVWTLLYPARKAYHAARYLRQNGVVGTYRNIEHALKNNRYARREEARQFLIRIMPSVTQKQQEAETKFKEDHKFSVVVPMYNTPELYLRDLLEATLWQTYQNWELCLADASDSDDGHYEEMIKEFTEYDIRVKYQKLPKNEGIAGNTNAAIRMATGSYIALLDHDDFLHPSALFECAKAIEKEGADFIYTDEVTFEGMDPGSIVTYHFKPDFSVDNLRGVNYICHLCVFKKELLDKVGMFRPEYDGSQDHDMILRLTDAAETICHIPKTLYFWRCHKESTSMNLDSKSYAIAAGKKAVSEAERRRGYPARVHSAQICKTHYRMEYEIGSPDISILIDGSKSGIDKMAHTLAAVEKIATYQNYTVECVASQEEFLEAFRRAGGTYVLILAAGITPVTPSFLEELLMFAQRDDVGLVGMQVLDEKNLILSSDLVIGDSEDTLAIEVNRGGRYDAPGYMGRNYYAHNVSAVSGCACMGKKEEIFPYFAEADASATAGRMLDVCFRLREVNRQIVLNPYALCRMRKADWKWNLTEADRQVLLATYRGQVKQGDPFYNENFSLEEPWKMKRVPYAEQF